MTSSTAICLEGYTLSAKECQLAIALSSYLQTEQGTQALQIGHSGMLSLQTRATFVHEIMKNATYPEQPAPFDVILPALIDAEDSPVKDALRVVYDRPDEWESRAARALAQWAGKKTNVSSR